MSGSVPESTAELAEPPASRDGMLRLLAELSPGELAVSGGKVRGLRQLLDAGLPVPPAMVWLPGVEVFPRSAVAEVVAQLGAGPWFVRSSFAIEDGRQASFAGQGGTEAHVLPEDLPAAVARVWDSWNRPSARAYRRRQGLFGARAGAVIIQQEVFPLRSGVLFSRAPDAVGDWARLEAARGYGEALVSGRLQPEVVDFHRRANRSLAPVPVLLRGLVRRFRRLLPRLEALHDGEPVDVEWCLDARERLWLLQLRPVTVRPEPLWSAGLGAEFWSGRVSRLMFETVGQRIERAMLQAPLAVVGAATGPLLRRADGRIYVEMRALSRALAIVPPWAVTETVLRMFPAQLRARYLQERKAWAPLFPPALLRAIPRFLAARFPWFPGSQWWHLPALRRRAEVWRETPLPTDPAQLACEVEAVLRDLERGLRPVAWAMLYAYVLTPLTERVLQPAMGDRDAAALMHALPWDPVAALDGDLRALVRRHPRLADPAAQASADEAAALDAFVKRWGHRAEERDLRGRRLAERPDWARWLAGLAAGPRPPLPPHWSRWLWRNRKRLGPARLLAGFGLVPLTRAYLGFREAMRDLADRHLWALRQRFLALAASASLDDPWARGWSGQAFCNDPDPDLLRFGETAPAFLIGDRALPDPAGGPADDLAGLPASPGRGVGRAVWVCSPEDLAGFSPGDVLVGDYLDPSLSLALERAAGAVFRHGGTLSHGAIIAREYGVPAVVGVPGLARVRSGDRIEIDGDAGRVRILVEGLADD